MPYAICTRSYVLSFKQILIAKKYMKYILPFDVKKKNKNKKNQQNIIRISNDIALNVEEFHLLLLEKNS